ncbi:MAG TPA: DUF5681 domain-containing protein [Stellaceae bacterium]|nr:DUF5681 domain-containing protein [Stellaceae bacterium]
MSAVDSLQISAKTAKPKGRSRGRSFRKGQSGNPAGRPLGSRNRASLAIAALLDGEAEALARKAVELALGGNALALKLCLDRLSAPRRDPAVSLALPAIGSAADLAEAMAALARAAAAGELTPAEAFDLARVADSFLKIIAARDDAAARRERAARSAREAANPRREIGFREWLDDHFAEP